MPFDGSAEPVVQLSPLPLSASLTHSRRLLTAHRSRKGKNVGHVFRSELEGREEGHRQIIGECSSGEYGIEVDGGGRTSDASQAYG